MIALQQEMRNAQLSQEIADKSARRMLVWDILPARSHTVLPRYYHVRVAVRRKRSISMPPDLDAEIEAAARAGGTTYSAWLAAAARKEFLIRDGLAGVAEFEREHRAFTETELAEADAWADDAVRRSRRSGNRPRKSA